jgi:type IV pilus assembly protein PilV
MTRSGPVPAKFGGFSMIEVLVSLLIIVFGLLGLAGLQVRIQQAEFESYQRAQALVLLQDMVERIHLHRVAATCFRFTTNTTNGSPFVGTGSGSDPTCSTGSAADDAMAAAAITEWKNLLLGASEDLGGSSVGAMQGARGCVSYNPATELTDPVTAAALPDTGLYVVAVSWKGTNDTFAPTVNCGNDNALYGAESKRRVVSTTFRLAKLN